MSTINELKIILSRLEKCPLNLVRVELEMFLNLLNSDTHLYTLISQIKSTNESKLGGKVAHIVNDIQSSTWTDLSFANTAALRAVVGYQYCECMLNDKNPITFGKKAIAIGARYAALMGTSPSVTNSEAIRISSGIFLEPLVSYLTSGLEIHHRILLLLSRYRQRSEWFKDNIIINNILEDKGEVEKKLKRNFFLYLFDNGIDFSIESETPEGGAEVDVLAILPEIGPLPIEVKVYDDKNRNTSYVSGGLAQAIEYARKFNSSEAYYLVYNVAQNKRLILPGTSDGGQIIKTQLSNVTLNSIVINLRTTYSASHAKNLESVNIPLPSMES